MALGMGRGRDEGHRGEGSKWARKKADHFGVGKKERRPPARVEKDENMTSANEKGVSDKRPAPVSTCSKREKKSRTSPGKKRVEEACSNQDLSSYIKVKKDSALRHTCQHKRG